MLQNKWGLKSITGCQPEGTCGGHSSQPPLKARLLPGSDQVSPGFGWALKPSEHCKSSTSLSILFLLGYKFTLTSNLHSSSHDTGPLALVISPALSRKRYKPSSSQLLFSSCKWHPEEPLTSPFSLESYMLWFPLTFNITSSLDNFSSPLKTPVPQWLMSYQAKLSPLSYQSISMWCPHVKNSKNLMKWNMVSWTCFCNEAVWLPLWQVNTARLLLVPHQPRRGTARLLLTTRTRAPSCCCLTPTHPAQTSAGYLPSAYHCLLPLGRVNPVRIASSQKAALSIFPNNTIQPLPTHEHLQLMDDKTKKKNTYMVFK